MSTTHFGSRFAGRQAGTVSLSAFSRAVAAGLAIAGVAIAAGVLSAGCAASTHAARPSALGAVSSAAAMEALINRPGPVEVETVVGADWAGTRAGLINLDAPAAKAAHLTDGDEPIQIFVHVLRHPTRGTFLIDTGGTRQLVEDPRGGGAS